MSDVPHITDPAWQQWFYDRYIHPIGEMFADPVQYAAYRARVEAALKEPAEVRRREELDAWISKYIVAPEPEPPA
jgi:hypothetical protein